MALEPGYDLYYTIQPLNEMPKMSNNSSGVEYYDEYRFSKLKFPNTNLQFVTQAFYLEPFQKMVESYTSGTGEDEWALDFKKDTPNTIARKYYKTLSYDKPSNNYRKGLEQLLKNTGKIFALVYREINVNNGKYDTVYLPKDCFKYFGGHIPIGVSGKTWCIGQAIKAEDDHDARRQDYDIQRRIFNNGLRIRFPSPGHGITKLGIQGNCFEDQSTVPFIEFGYAYWYGTESLPTTLQISIIGDYAFSGCSSLRYFGCFAPGGGYKLNRGQVLNISQISSIGEYAFANCKSLDFPKFIFSDSTDEIKIGAYAFQNCPGIDEDKISSSKQITIGEYAFENSGMTNILQCARPGVAKGCYKRCSKLIDSPTWIEGTTDIGAEAFEASGLNNLTTPSSLKHIGERAFANCNYLTNIALEYGLVAIGPGAFKIDNGKGDGTANYSITIPKTVKYIHSEAFKNRTHLTKIIFETGRSEPLYIGWDAFYNTGIIKLELPHDTVVLGQGFVHSCQNLQSISFREREDTESSDDNKYTTYIGNWAFCGCSKLKTIDFKNKGNNWKWATNFGLSESYAAGINREVDFGYIFEGYVNNDSGYGGGQNLYYDFTRAYQDLTLTVPWEMVQYSNIPPNTKYLYILGSEGRTSIDLYEQLSTAHKLVDIYLTENSNINEIIVKKSQHDYYGGLLNIQTFFCNSDIVSESQKLYVGDNVKTDIQDQVGDLEKVLGLSLHKYQEIWFPELNAPDGTVYRCNQLFVSSGKDSTVTIMHYIAKSDYLPERFAQDFSKLLKIYFANDNIFIFGKQSFSGCSALGGFYQENNKSLASVRFIIRENAFEDCTTLVTSEGRHKYIAAGLLSAYPILIYWRPDVSSCNIWALEGFNDTTHIAAIQEASIALTDSITTLTLPFMGGCYYPTDKKYIGYFSSLRFALWQAYNKIQKIIIKQKTSINDQFTILAGTQENPALDGIDLSAFKELEYWGHFRTDVSDKDNYIFPKGCSMTNGSMAFIKSNRIPAYFTQGASLEVKQINIVEEKGTPIIDFIFGLECFYNIQHNSLILQLPTGFQVESEASHKSWFNFNNVQIQQMAFPSTDIQWDLIQWNSLNNVPYAYVKQVRCITDDIDNSSLFLQISADNTALEKYKTIIAPDTYEINIISPLSPYVFYNQRFINDLNFVAFDGFTDTAPIFGSKNALINIRYSNEGIKALLEAKILNDEKLTYTNWLANDSKCSLQKKEYYQEVQEVE